MRSASGRPLIALTAVLPPEFARARPNPTITARCVTVMEPSSAAVTVTICMIREPELSPTAFVSPVPISAVPLPGAPPAATSCWPPPTTEPAARFRPVLPTPMPMLTTVTLWSFALPPTTVTPCTTWVLPRSPVTFALPVPMPA